MTVIMPQVQQVIKNIPSLFEFATFNYVGFLKPDQVITAESRRGAEIPFTVRFEVKDNGFINYEGFKFSNMQPRPEIHEYFCMIDPRIPPCNEYIDVDDRPYQEHGTITFNLQSGIEITDLSSNSPAAAGGNNGSGIFLPPIIYPAPIAPVIDLSAGTKVQGANTGAVTHALDESDSESTGSSDDLLLQMAQFLRRRDEVIVILVGHFKGYQDMESIVHFRQNYAGQVPNSTQELFQFAFEKIASLSNAHGSSGIPRSLYWTTVTFTPTVLDITLSRSGKGLQVTFFRQETPGLAISEFPSTYGSRLS
jgi:hypothetical protein